MPCVRMRKSKEKCHNIPAREITSSGVKNGLRKKEKKGDKEAKKSFPQSMESSCGKLFRDLRKTINSFTVLFCILSGFYAVLSNKYANNIRKTEPEAKNHSLF